MFIHLLQIKANRATVLFLVVFFIAIWSQVSPANHAGGPARLQVSPANHAGGPAWLQASPANHAGGPAWLQVSPANRAGGPARLQVSPANRAGGPAWLQASPANHAGGPARLQASPAWLIPNFYAYTIYIIYVWVNQRRKNIKSIAIALICWNGCRVFIPNIICHCRMCNVRGRMTDDLLYV